jgi:catechol 2,3-dioxygenase-like lactoylglutathione lyase family enzyme
MTLQTATLMAFVATTNAERTKAFYRDTLGLKLVSDEAFALVFDANGTMLRVQKVDAFTPQSFTALGWQVAAIRATTAALIASGVEMSRFGWMPQDELGIWTADDGAQVAWFRDPDGNVLSITQFP